MSWSALKKKVESRFAASVRGRVQLHMAGYHGAPDHDGRAWITLDGREIVSFCDFREARVAFDAVVVLGAQGVDDANPPLWDRLSSDGTFGRDLFIRTLGNYLNMSVADALQSTHPLTRALAIVDRRVGKRRLARLDVTTDLPFVEELHRFRCACEGLPGAATTGRGATP